MLSLDTEHQSFLGGSNLLSRGTAVIPSKPAKSVSLSDICLTSLKNWSDCGCRLVFSIFVCFPPDYNLFWGGTFYPLQSILCFLNQIGIYILYLIQKEWSTTWNQLYIEAHGITNNASESVFLSFLVIFLIMVSASVVFLVLGEFIPDDHNGLWEKPTL